MILVINATNRAGNQSQYISKYCSEYLENELDQQVEYLTLEDLPYDMIHDKMYISEHVSPSLAKIQDNQVIPSNKWLIVCPEYNGSYSGIFKLFIDAMSVRKYKQTFAHRKAGLIGTADGRAGNLRGLEHMTGFLNYLKITVFPNKLPVSTVGKLIKKTEIDEGLKETLDAYLKDFVKWID